MKGTSSLVISLPWNNVHLIKLYLPPLGDSSVIQALLLYRGMLGNARWRGKSAQGSLFFFLSFLSFSAFERKPDIFFPWKLMTSGREEAAVADGLLKRSKISCLHINVFGSQITQEEKHK